jgi:hypothetical protein
VKAEDIMTCLSRRCIAVPSVGTSHSALMLFHVESLVMLVSNLHLFYIPVFPPELSGISLKISYSKSLMKRQRKTEEKNKKGALQFLQI